MKYDVHLSTGAIIAIEAAVHPFDHLVGPTTKPTWYRVVDDLFAVDHIVAIVPHVDIDEPIPYLPTADAPARVIDGDGEVWIRGEGGLYYLDGVGETPRTLDYIEREYEITSTE